MLLDVMMHSDMNPVQHFIYISVKMTAPERNKQGRPKLTWVEGIRGLVGEKGLMEEDWNDRSTWRKEII
jgi:hypothetical protein